MKAARAMARELAVSPWATGLALSAVTAGALRAARLPGRQALAFGAVIGAVEGSHAGGRNRVVREVRSATEAASLSAHVGHPLPFGGGAVDGDFGRVMLDAVTSAGDRPSIVELGAGVSTALLARGAAERDGRVITVEHDDRWATVCTDRLRRLGLESFVTIFRAPLVLQEFSDCRVAWYAPEVIALVSGPIDLLVVDGPPSSGGRDRWPALEVLHDRLSSRATVLVDDGRRHAEARMARRWAHRHELELRYIDTLKGAWRLTRGAGAARPAPVRLARAVNPYPAAYGLEAVRG
jgi:predicted O-methyltransferase YrrM